MTSRLNRFRSQTLFAHIFDITVINYVLLVLNLATGVITARMLGPSQKGVYYAVTSWIDIISYFAALGTNPAFIWFYRGDVNKRSVVRKAIIISVTLVTVASLISCFLIWYPLHRLGTSAVLWAIVYLLMLPFGTVSGMSTTYLMISQQVTTFNVLRVVQTVVTTGVLITLGIWHTLNLTSYFITLIGTSLIANIYLTLLAIGRYRHETEDRLLPVPGVAEFMRKSISYFIPSLSSLFNSRLDQMICTLFLSKTELGLYGVASASLGVVGSLLGGFTTMFFTSMAQSDTELIQRRGNRAFRIYLFLSLIGVTLIISLSSEVLKFLYGRKYVAAYPIVVGLAPVPIFSGLIGILYQGFFSMGKPIYATVSEAVGALSGALLIWVLAPKYGSVGVAIANSLSYVLDFAVCLVFWTKMGGRFRDLIPIWQDVADLWTASVGRLRLLFN